jgi:hypothetical protein
MFSRPSDGSSEVKQSHNQVALTSGLGTMDFSFHVENDAAARQLLAQVIGEIAPEVNYTVEAVED